MKQVRFSKQRQAIYSILLESKEHPTAETIYQKLKGEIPGLSLGTVYRNLNFLVESHQAIKVDVGDKLEHFDATISPHYHLCCTNCHSIIDLDIEYDKLLTEKVASITSLDIDSHSTIFYGVCHTCAKDKN